MMLEFREATNRLRQWPPSLRWAALLLPAILLIAASGWYYNASRSDPTVVLLEGQPLSDAQLAVVVQAFAKAKLTNYSIREHCLYVPRTQLGAYLTAVADSGVLPKGLQSNSEQVIGDVRLLESERDRERRVSHGASGTWRWPSGPWTASRTLSCSSTRPSSAGCKEGAW